jgi:hypothetical protein
LLVSLLPLLWGMVLLLLLLFAATFALLVLDGDLTPIAKHLRPANGGLFCRRFKRQRATLPSERESHPTTWTINVTRGQFD